MKGDGCGAHETRDETCEWCLRWDWEPNLSRHVHLLAELVCVWNRCGHVKWEPNDPRHETDDSYELTKREFRYAGSLLNGLQENNIMLVEAPPCRCGVRLGDEVHQAIIVSEMVDGKHVIRPNREDQHPYEPVQ